MKRKVQIEYDEASPTVQDLYDEIMRTMGSPTLPNLFKAFGIMKIS